MMMLQCVVKAIYQILVSPEVGIKTMLVSISLFLTYRVRLFIKVIGVVSVYQLRIWFTVDKIEDLCFSDKMVHLKKTKTFLC